MPWRAEGEFGTRGEDGSGRKPGGKVVGERRKRIDRNAGKEREQRVSVCETIKSGG